MSISRSGTSASPITFLANYWLSYVSVDPIAGGHDAFDLTDAAHVVIKGFDTVSFGGHDYLIDNSSDVTIDAGYASNRAAAAVEIINGSSNVTVSQATIYSNGGSGVDIGQGVTGVSVLASTIVTVPAGDPSRPSIAVTGSPGARITGDTLVTECGSGIGLSGASTSASVQDNIVETGVGIPAPGPCTTPTGATAITVSGDSAPQTTTDYNLIDPGSGGPLYSWNGTTYADLASFTAATAQGAHDISAPAGLATSIGGSNGFYFPLASSSPAIDSANARAPGEPAADMLGNARADDPDVANAGTGIGYFDRGAAELQGALTFGGQSLSRDPAAGPLDVVAAAQVSTSWTTNGPIGSYLYGPASYTPFVDRFATITSATTQQLAFATAGRQCITIFESIDGFRGAGHRWSGCTLIGADYQPITPARVLDTRAGVGVAARPVPAGKDVVLAIPPTNGVSAADISAVVVNVTVTGATAAGGLTVYPDQAGQQYPPNVLFAKDKPAASTLTLKLLDGKIVFHNGSRGPVQVTADMDGYYGGSGYGFAPVRPVRVLDTSHSIGTTRTTPVGPHAHLVLDLSGQVPAGAAAAMLTVTAVSPKATGSVLVYPHGAPKPAAASLRFSAGSPASNLVIVRLAGDKADIVNNSAGTVRLVADLSGYFGTAASGASDSYVPAAPLLLADTLHGGGFDDLPIAPVPAHHILSVPGWSLDAADNCASCAPPTAWLWDVTVLRPAAPGYGVAYGDGHGRPPLAWSLSFTAGHPASDLAAVRASGATGLAYNDSAGSVRLVVDEEGYFIGPP